MIRFRKWRAGGGLGSDQPGFTSRAYSVEVESSPGNVNGRQHKLWRADSRYPGQVTVYRDPESGGAVLEFDALRHGAKEPRLREVVAAGGAAVKAWGRHLETASKGLLLGVLLYLVEPWLWTAAYVGLLFGGRYLQWRAQGEKE